MLLKLIVKEKEGVGDRNPEYGALLLSAGDVTHYTTINKAIKSHLIITGNTNLRSINVRKKSI